MRIRAVPRWAVVSGFAAPILLVVTSVVAQHFQPPGYDPIRDTISGLAGLKAHDRWLMTAGFVAIGLSYLATAVGLRPVRLSGRAVLGVAGVAVIAVAACPQPPRGGSPAHGVATAVALVALAVWPTCAAPAGTAVVLLSRRGLIAVGGIVLGSALWFAIDMHGPTLGLAERVAALCEASWPTAIALSARRVQLDQATDLARAWVTS